MKIDSCRHIIIFFFCAGILCGSTGDRELYGNIPAERYLTGRFDPIKSPLFIELSSLKIPTDGRKHFLRREAAVSLAGMIRNFEKDHPKVKLFIRSSTRTWDDQKWIWENKWHGKTPVEGNKLNEKYKDPYKRALKILEYSSMPGTSRHHWGTDFDINHLVNSYYETGEGKIILSWMEKNAGRYGFSRPYRAGRKTGYKEEKWHWSYVPLSCLFNRHWLQIYARRPELLIHDGSFAGAEASLRLATEFVRSIDIKCR